MNELIIEGLTEDDLIDLYQIISEIAIPISDIEKHEKVKSLFVKLGQVIDFLKTTPNCETA